MKSKLFIIILALILTLALVGCSGDEPSEKTDEPSLQQDADQTDEDEETNDEADPQ